MFPFRIVSDCNTVLLSMGLHYSELLIPESSEGAFLAHADGKAVAYVDMRNGGYAFCRARMRMRGIN